jgi:iron complex transport system substrate-binding protein
MNPAPNKILAWIVILNCIVSLIQISLHGTRVWADMIRINGKSIQDQAGRIITIDRPFQRIVSLYGAHTENLFELGSNDLIVGVSRNEVYPPEALEKPVFSYHDDPEKFLASGPDLVLIRPMIDRGYPQLISRLEENDITVVSLQPSTINELRTYWRILGYLTGKQEQAQSMVSRFDSAVSDYKAKGSAIRPKKRVYFEAIHSKMKTFSPESMSIFALETAGGINIAQDAQPVRRTNIAAYGKERIMSHANQIDVYLAQYGQMNRPTVDMIKTEPGFSAIKAIRNDEVYLIDEMIVSRPTLRLLEGIQVIAGILYPDIFGRHIEKRSAKQQ